MSHPRPQMKRAEYKILQDGWALNAQPIRVPYPPQSELSMESADGNFEAVIPAPHLWTPEDPYLYDMTITAGEDRVKSYFALRTIDIRNVQG